MHESATPVRKLRPPSPRRVALLAGVAALGVSALFAGSHQEVRVCRIPG